jgi:hypothetical protein
LQRSEPVTSANSTITGWKNIVNAACVALRINTCPRDVKWRSAADGTSATHRIVFAEVRDSRAYDKYLIFLTLSGDCNFC